MALRFNSPLQKRTKWKGELVYYTLPTPLIPSVLTFRVADLSASLGFKNPHLSLPRSIPCFGAGQSEFIWKCCMKVNIHIFFFKWKGYCIVSVLEENDAYAAVNNNKCICGMYYSFHFPSVILRCTAGAIAVLNWTSADSM